MSTLAKFRLFTACVLTMCPWLHVTSYAHGPKSQKGSSSESQKKRQDASSKTRQRFHTERGPTLPTGCDRIGALLLIDQQLESAKSIDDAGQRIDLMLRAADALWPYNRQRASLIFKDAFGEANKDLEAQRSQAKEKKDFWPKIIDRRETVLSAVARRDPALGAALARDVAKQEESAEENSLWNFAKPFSRSSGQLIEVALSMLPDGEQSAIGLVSGSFRYPPSLELPAFLYTLAGFDRPAADQLYRQALAAYAGGSLQGLFYLSAYPFASDGFYLPGVMGGQYQAPEGFAPSPELQQMFLTALLERAQKSAVEANQHDLPYPGSMTECTVLYIALQQIEPEVRRYEPGLLKIYSSVEQQLWLAVPTDERQRVGTFNASMQLFRDRSGMFEEAVSRTEATPESDWRDEYLFEDIVGAPASVPAERLEKLTNQITDSRVRDQVQNWLYFRLARRALKQGDVKKAREAAGHVSPRDFQACLYLEIAAEELKHGVTKARALEILEEIVATALDSQPTMQQAQALAGAVPLYARHDPVRATEVLGEAVDALNKVENPGLLQTRAVREAVHGRYLSGDLSFQFQPVELEAAVSVAAGIDFPGTLLLCRTLDSKYLRGVAIIAASRECLKAVRKQADSEKRKSKKPAPAVKHQASTPHLRTLTVPAC